MSGSRENVNFNGIVHSDAYGYVPTNYDGFDWSDVLAMGKQYVANNEADTGFASALRGQGVGYTSAAVGYGYVYSASTLFTLQSGIFASAWETDQPILFVTSSYFQGHHKVSEVPIYLSQTAKTINFANYGNDFKDLNLLLISPYPGLAGSQGTYGYQVAMDNLRVKLDGAIAPHHHRSDDAPIRQLRANHGAVAHAQSFGNHFSQDHEAGPNPAAPYHSQLTAWDHDPGGGLTAQFALPSVEHGFGT
jgi:hypothetical protein